MSETVQEASAAMVEEVGSPAVAEDDQNLDDSIDETDEELNASSDESLDDSEEDSDDAEESLNQQIKDLKKKLKLKVDGQEIEEEIDFNDDETLTRHLQKAKAFDKKAQELAQLKREIEGLVGTLKTNPQAVLNQLGLDFDELAEQHIRNQIEEMSKSPEQLAFEKMQKELAELKSEKERLAKEKEESETERLRNEQAAILEQDILSALNNSNTLLSVEDPEVVSDIARAMYRAMNEGYTDVTVQDVIPMVEKRYFDKLTKRMELMDDDSLEKVFGKHADRLRKRRLSKKKDKVKTATAKQIAKSTGISEQPKDEMPQEKLSYKDFFRKF